MTRLRKLTGVFMLAAAVGLAGCVPTPGTTEAKAPDAVATTVVTQQGAAIVNATTRIGANNLYEITPVASKNLTCFMSASIYTGSAVSGSSDCVPKVAGTEGTPTAAATIESATTIGANNFYEVTPATRKDVTCFVTASVYSGSAVSGSIRCLPKAGM